jgi:hypothetical protein
MFTPCQTIPRPATCEEIDHALSYGLQFSTNGKAHRHGDNLAAAIAASTLVDHLEQSRFVLMKKPPAKGAAPEARRNSQHPTE